MTKLVYTGFQRITTTRFLRHVCLLALTVSLLTSAAIGLATASESGKEKENSNRERLPLLALHRSPEPATKSFPAPSASHPQAVP